MRIFSLFFGLFVVYVSDAALTRLPISQANGQPTIQTSKGWVEGKMVKTDKNNWGYAFQGIPFGEAPTANLRFKKPVARSAWNGTLMANDFGPFCPQPLVEFTNYTSDEDCLTLNVYTPTPYLGMQNDFPVLFYVFGGGWEFGAPNGYPADAMIDHFASRDTIIVFPNYRVGVLGAWSSGTDEASGNNMMWDLKLALEWVKDEISNFGGDPNKVTIMGESSGGASTTLLTLSPQTDGLFQQAIPMSGTLTYSGEFPTNGSELDAYRDVATAVGCNENNEWQNDAEAVSITL